MLVVLVGKLNRQALLKPGALAAAGRHVFIFYGDILKLSPLRSRPKPCYSTFIQVENFPGTLTVLSLAWPQGH
jgi:hypothetical protein